MCAASIISSFSFYDSTCKVFERERVIWCYPSSLSVGKGKVFLIKPRKHPLKMRNRCAKVEDVLTPRNIRHLSRLHFNSNPVEKSPSTFKWNQGVPLKWTKCPNGLMSPLFLM